jgi:hypothetical protein
LDRMLEFWRFDHTVQGQAMMTASGRFFSRDAMAILRPEEVVRSQPDSNEMAGMASHPRAVASLEMFSVHVQISISFGFEDTGAVIEACVAARVRRSRLATPLVA